MDRELKPGAATLTSPSATSQMATVQPGKQTRVEATFGAPVAIHIGAPVQRIAGAGEKTMTDDHVHAAAARGVAGAGGSLPHLDTIQRMFGRHDVRGVQAHVGGHAAEASQAIGAEAYASGGHVAFAGAPSLHTAAHEAAHVVQQRGGVQLKGGVGAAGDPYEQHADQVADAVVRGESVESLLDAHAGGTSGASSAVQRRPAQVGADAAPADGDGRGQLGYLLAQPAPALGDPVVSYLMPLPLPKMLDELAEAVACGYALKLEARLAAAPPILSAALQAASLARYTRLTPAHPALARTGAALDNIALDQQVGILSWMLTRRGVSIEATSLVEGAIAIREDQHEGAGEKSATRGTDGDSSTAVAGASGAMPSPIEKGTWEPPGEQPRGLYVGTAVHTAIGVHYLSKHRGNDVRTNDFPIKTILRDFKRLSNEGNETALDEDELGKRPDILNLTLKHLYEIKPEDSRPQARAKLTMYKSILAKAGIMVELGPTEDPGVNGQLPAPDGTVMFECTEPGVVTYRYRHSRLVPVPVPSHAKQRSRDWKWAFEKDLTREQRSAMVTTTVGGAVLILLFVVLSPVGA